MEYILDSSVIIKWFSHKNEKHVEKALVILNLLKEQKVKIFIPELSLYEISNALRFNNNFTRHEVSQILKTLMDLELNILFLNREIIDTALEFAYKESITVYDAVFMAISFILKIPLITANPKHQKLTKTRNIMIPLEDF